VAETFRADLARLLKARYPLLFVESFEEQRVLAEVRAVAQDVERLRTPRGVATWSVTQGLVGPDGVRLPDSTEPARALEAALATVQPTVFVFHDLHTALGVGNRQPDVRVVRLLRDVATAFKSGPVARTLVLVSPVLSIPPELEKDITLIDFPLPDGAEVGALLDGLIQANAVSGRIRIDVDAGARERLVQAAAGLTLHEAENAFARAMVDGSLSIDDVDLVLEEKRQTIRKSGLLEFVPVEVSLADVGGLENLKRWLGRRDSSWLAEAAGYGLPAPKGLLVTGVPGCGKSLTAKATAATWGLPLLRLDIGRVFAGLVGSSEQNMRAAIRTAEATAPCVLWIDEIEKGFSGGGAGGGDSGTSSRVFGTFLTWMQEKTRPVFVIATANTIERLPAEFLRKGRFDEIFFVDLPTHIERTAIWALHLARRLGRPAVAGQVRADDETVRGLADATGGYSGAEIEQAVVAALFEAFAERRPLRLDDLHGAVRAMVPLSLVQFEQVEALRAWAALRAVSATGSEDLDGTGFLQPTDDDPTDRRGTPR
jgi:ATP-dependent 26S proteasome regulatory subunit